MSLFTHRNFKLISIDLLLDGISEHGPILFSHLLMEFVATLIDFFVGIGRDRELTGGDNRKLDIETQKQFLGNNKELKVAEGLRTDRSVSTLS